MNEKKLSRPLISLIVSIALIIVGIAGSFILQTNSGKTTIRNVTIESESGHTLAMDVYIPENATAETPAPAIFVQHGGNNNKEEMQHYCIELARRGYVAIGVDMYGMGESEPLPDSEWLTQGRGLYDAVRYGVTLPYVDTDRVSLLGYSRGGKAAGEALQCDNDSLNVVKAIFLIHSDPIVRNSEGYTDVYGARDVAVLADKNDEFFFSEKANDNGTYSNDANKYAANLSSPAEYFVDVNFLIVYWGFMKFGANRIPGMLLVVPMYLVYYIVMSISVNSFNFSTALGKNKLLSNLLISFIASVPTLFILCYVYGIFKATGSNPMFGGLASAATAVYALPGFIFVAILICRLLYQHTGNPYLGGIFCGVLAAVSEWGICEIRVHTPGTQYAGTALVYALIAIGFVVTIACAVLLKKNNAAVQAHK